MMPLIAVVRRWFWRRVMRYDSEICFDCGRKVELVWTAPEWMWGQAMGHEGGILCPRCFEERMGHPNVMFIRWVPQVEPEWMAQISEEQYYDEKERSA